eukprot:scaffold48_cov311-Pinguiococcus_pyrenoidosus.AAC.199
MDDGEWIMENPSTNCVTLPVRGFVQIWMHGRETGDPEIVGNGQALLEHCVHYAKGLGLLDIHVRVPIHHALDLLQGLARVVVVQLIESSPGADDLFGLDRDVRGHALSAPAGLVQHDLGIGQGEALLRSTRREQERAHGRRLPHADGADLGTDVLHRVVDGQASRDQASGRVDIHEDVLLGRLSFQEEQLRRHDGRHVVGDGAVNYYDALLQKPTVDIKDPLPAGRALQDHGHEHLRHRAAAEASRRKKAPVLVEKGPKTPHASTAIFNGRKDSLHKLQGPRRSNLAWESQETRRSGRHQQLAAEEFGGAHS